MEILISRKRDNSILRITIGRHHSNFYCSYLISIAKEYYQGSRKVHVDLIAGYFKKEE